NGASSITEIVGCDTAIINHQALFNFNNAAQLLLKEFKVGLINEQVTSEAAFVSSTGLIKFENSAAAAQDLCFQNRNNGAIFNSSCGQMELFGTFENSSLILNQAFFRMMPTPDFTIVPIGGTFNNEGVIEDVQGKLQTNNINNTDAILRPTCLGNAQDGTIFEVVQLGSNLSFTIDTDWTVANVGAGTFDINTNTTTFQNPFPNQPVVATFAVTDDANNCTLNLSEPLDFTPNNQAVPINVGDDQTNLCTLNTLLSGNSPNQNTTGIWSFTDPADGAGIIFEPTNPESEFSGNFSQNYTLRWTQNATCGSGSDEVLIAFNGDTDNDFICDDEDVCADGDDRVDNNNDGIPDDCEGGNTPCSEDHVTVSENPIVAGTFHARQNLTSSGIIATNTDVVFKAGTSITLQAGFSANAGSNFLATIEACPATLVTREMDSQALNRNDFENHGDLKAYLPQKASVEVFPNPVHHYTTIAIDLPKTTSIQLDLHDLNGRKVANLFVSTLLKKGAHLFEWQCDQVKAGMYLVVLNGQIKTKLVIVN
ncbi:MAG: T9SS type A sorting domain-containing protein, partial [Bacteroidota bacterium]